MTDRQLELKKQEARTNEYKNKYDRNSQWGYVILVIALIVFVCAFSLHDRHHVQYNPNGHVDTYRNCQTPYMR